MKPVSSALNLNWNMIGIWRTPSFSPFFLSTALCDARQSRKLHIDTYLHAALRCPAAVTAQSSRRRGRRPGTQTRLQATGGAIQRTETHTLAYGHHKWANPMLLYLPRRLKQGHVRK